MYRRRRASYGRRGGSTLGRIIDSNTNHLSLLDASPDGTTSVRTIANTVDSATLAVQADVERGCIIKAVWIEFWAQATAVVTTGTTNQFEAYLFKNPGSNLTPPTPGTQGTSNEKKFIMHSWKGLVGPRIEGYQAYEQRGRWFKIPKRYQRFGANDLLQLIFVFNGVAGLLCQHYVYKWYK